MRSTSPTARPPHALVERDRRRPTGGSTSWSTPPAACAGRSAGRSRRSAEADWHAIFQANVDGAFWLAQAASRPMRGARYGRIVNIASGAGLRPSLTGIQAYTAAKHALVGLTKQLVAGSRAASASPPTRSRRASCAPTRRPSGNGKAMAPRARSAWSRASTRAASARPRTSPTPCCFFASDQASWITGPDPVGRRRPVMTGPG